MHVMWDHRERTRAIQVELGRVQYLRGGHILDSRRRRIHGVFPLRDRRMTPRGLPSPCHL